MHVARIGPTVDSVVAEHFEQRSFALTGLRRRRVDDAEAALRRCFEEHADAALLDHEQALLHLERLFAEDGAAARVASPDALLVVLVIFLRDPEWHGADHVDRTLRAVTASELAHRIEHLPILAEVDTDAAVGAVDAARRRTRRALREERSEENRRSMIARGQSATVDALDRALAELPPRPLRPPAPPIPQLTRPFPARFGPLS